MTHAPRLTAIVVPLTLIAACSSPDSRGTTSNEGAGQSSAADVPLDIVDYEGVHQRIKSHAGKLVVLDAWSTSCAPCIKEFPNLVALSHKYPDRVACISLSFDFYGVGKPEDHREHVHAFLKRKKATFDNLLSSVESNEMFRKFNIYGPPAVLVYGPDGQLLKQFDGSTGEEVSYKDVEAFLVTQLPKIPDR